jgi:hypothetical protein
MKTNITIELTADDLYDLARAKNPELLTGAHPSSVTVIARTGGQLDEREIRTTVRGSTVAAEIIFEVR